MILLGYVSSQLKKLSPLMACQKKFRMQRSFFLIFHIYHDTINVFVTWKIRGQSKFISQLIACCRQENNWKHISLSLIKTSYRWMDLVKEVILHPPTVLLISLIPIQEDYICSFSKALFLRLSWFFFLLVLTKYCFLTEEKVPSSMSVETPVLWS